MPLAAASRYARALVDVALAPGSELDPAKATEELAAFESTVAASSELRHVLLSPAVSNARKRAVVGRLAPALGLSRLVRNFLYVVIDHRRAASLGEIRTAFQALLDERRGVARAEVTSAAELGAVQRQSLTAQLGRLTGKQVRCEFQVDGDLLGGVVARIGSTIYDGSVQGQLRALRARLADGS